MRLALSSFSGNSSNKRIILLISDGEPLEGDIFRIVAESVNEDIPVYTVAAGTAAGSNIPVGDDFVRNRQGTRGYYKNRLLSSYRIWRNLLMGSSINWRETQVIAELSQEIKSMEYNSSGGRIKYVNVVQFRPFLILALVFLSLYIFIKEWRWSEIF